MMTSEITVLRGKRDVRWMPYLVAFAVLALIGAIAFTKHMDKNPPSSVSYGITYVTTPEQRAPAPDAQR